jgi:hypothetical protein
MHWYWRLHLKECPNTFEMSTAREDDTRYKRIEQSYCPYHGNGFLARDAGSQLYSTR